MMEEAAEEVDMLATDIEGRWTDKNIEASWKEAVANYVCSSIFPRKQQWVKDHKIEWGSGIQKIDSRLLMDRRRIFGVSIW
jgi:hypothetical protein